MLEKIKLLLSTVRWIKPKQVKYQLLYRLNKARTLSDYNQDYEVSKIVFPRFTVNPPGYKSLISENEFTFLNLTVTFEGEIDWNYQGNGKLWNYNLQYGNYLLQDDASCALKSKLIESIYHWLNDGRLPLEPYPVSLRIINVVRHLSSHQSPNEFILKNVHAELDFLSKRPEYHLLGNHLLENAFALMMGGALFSNMNWLNQGKTILMEELNEQLLLDGAHFELSPMYHQIILFRLLELIDWFTSYEIKDVNFENFLKGKASKMLSWLENITFSNGDIPHFNDSADDIAYSSTWLCHYAKLLDILPERGLALSRSGYRYFKMPNYECTVDVAQIGPTYQPGHGHADALSFIMYYKGNPLFVEQGTSTYQIGDRRNLERSTSAHNTVVVDGRDQSRVWGGFRVAERAHVDIIVDEKSSLSAKHNGYKPIGIEHVRTFKFLPSSVLIVDEAMSSQVYLKVAYFHLHPDIQVELIDEVLKLKGVGVLTADGAESIALESYNMAQGYNKYRAGQRIVIHFKNELKTNLLFN
jgi:hypothetical protein